MIPVIDTLAFIRSHPLASRRPLAAYARFAWWQVNSRLRDTVVFDWIDGSKLMAKKGMTGATGNIYCGLHEFPDMGFLMHFLKIDDLFVDAGANIGSWTVLASAVCGAEVIAIEPDPATAMWLRRNVEINGRQGRVRIVEAALGAARGSVHFTIGRDTTNCVVAEAAQGTREVELRPLDEVAANRSPELIKMDLEGYEAKAIAGARRILANPALLAILTETADSEVKETLQEFGFRHMHYEPFSRTLSARPDEKLSHSANYLFVRDVEAVQERIAAAPRREIFGVSV
jgi:FkbM family methyltransferase